MASAPQHDQPTFSRPTKRAKAPATRRVKGDGGGPPSDTPDDRPASRARSLSWLLVAVWAITLVGALLQPPHPDAYRVAPASAASLDWWLEPHERNAFLRLPGVRGVPLAFAEGPAENELWVVGTNGLVIRSTDNAQTWSVVPLSTIAQPDTFDNAQDRFPASGEAPPTKGASRLPAGGAVRQNSWTNTRSDDAQLNSAPSSPPDFRQQPPNSAAPNSAAQSTPTHIPPGIPLPGPEELSVASFFAVTVNHSEQEVTIGHSGEGVSLSTRDGGSTWRWRQDPPEIARERQEMDNLHTAPLNFSATAGRTLQRLRGGLIVSAATGAPVFRQTPVRVRFMSDREGECLAGLSGVFDERGSEIHLVATTLLRTGDGGRTWRTAARLPHDETPTPASLLVFRVNSAELHGANAAEDGVRSLPAYRPDPSAIAKRSTDGGASWQPLPLEPYAKYPAPWFYAFTALCIAGAVVLRRAADSSREHAQAPREKRLWIEGVGTSDDPIGPGDPDALNLGLRAEALSRFLRNPGTKAPITIAVEGPWGSGKSSMMRLVRARLDEAGFSTVEFNAWHHRTERDLLGGLLDRIRSGVDPAPSDPMQALYLRLRFRARLWWARFSSAVRKRPGYTLGIIAVCTLCAYMIYFHPLRAAYWLNSAHLYARTLISEKAITPDGAPAPLPTARDVTPFHLYLTNGMLGLVALVPIVRSTLKGLSTFGVSPIEIARKLSTKGQHEGSGAACFRAEMALRLREVTDALGPQRRLVIFIDDLDRCSEESVIDMLGTMNYLVTAAPVVLIAAFDTAYVKACIHMRYDRLIGTISRMEQAEAINNARHPSPAETAGHTQDRFATNFLEKLIQISEPVPALSPEQARNLMDRRGTAPVAGDGLPHTQRGSLSKALYAWRPVVLVASAVLFAVLLAESEWLTPPAEPPAPPPQATETPIAADDAPSSPLAPVRGNPRTWAPEPDLPPDLFAAAAVVHAPLPRLGITPGFAVVSVFSAGVLCFFAALSVGAARVPSPVQDSQEFEDAITEYASLLARAGKTPRSIKRMLNRLRLASARRDAMNDATIDSERDLVALGVIEEIDPAAIRDRDRIEAFLKAWLNDTDSPDAADLRDRASALAEHVDAYRLLCRGLSSGIGGRAPADTETPPSAEEPQSAQ